jgi:hypothetical protein
LLGERFFKCLLFVHSDAALDGERVAGKASFERAAPSALLDGGRLRDCAICEVSPNQN